MKSDMVIKKTHILFYLQSVLDLYIAISLSSDGTKSCNVLAATIHVLKSLNLYIILLQNSSSMLNFALFFLN